MSLRARLAILTTAGLVAAGFTVSLLFNPLCSVFHTRRHYATKAPAHVTQSVATTTPTSADHP
jgi:hypothetical protein